MKPAPRVAGDLVGRAGEISRSVLPQWASRIDSENRFPEENVAALRAAGLLGYFVPPALGGPGGDVRGYCDIAAALGAECLSTALIWGMHTHQVAMLADHRSAAHEPYLREIVDAGVLVASVTSEPGMGGEVLRSQAPIERDGDRLRVRRIAPVVSYGEHAGFFMVKMLQGPGRPPTDVRMVLLRAGEGTQTVTGVWDALGCRGTRSVPMQFDVEVDAHRLLEQPFRQIALETMIPMAHAGWVAAWIGAAKGALARFLADQREQHAAHLGSDLFLQRLAGLRLRIDQVEALLERVVRIVDEHRAGASLDVEDAGYNILINNLKIAGSCHAFAIVDSLVALSGLSRGYLRGDASGLERVFRDLRSAALMFANDRLMQANGRLVLAESFGLRPM